MTTRARFISAAAVAVLTALIPSRASAQGAPPPPPRNTPATTVAPAAAAPAPILVPATAPIPPAPQKVVTPASALPPSDSAVALCMNGTFVNKPGTSADCASRGGLRVAFTPHLRTLPATPAATAAASQQPAARSISVAVAPPIGATARCKDATFITTTPSQGMCDGHGGVAAVFPAAKPAPATPVKRP